jgi:dynein heavy chain
MEVVIE